MDLDSAAEVPDPPLPLRGISPRSAGGEFCNARVGLSLGSS